MKGGGGRGGWERPGGQQGRRLGSETRRTRDGRFYAADCPRRTRLATKTTAAEDPRGSGQGRQKDPNSQR
jgi:hypothetical protein